MNQSIKRVLFGFGIAIFLLVGYVSVFGIYPRFFDIEWDEEVQLHDGKIIVVHVKRTFERLNSFRRNDGMYRDTEIAFDAGPPWGRYHRKFVRYEVDMIESLNGNWYLALGVTTGTPPEKVVDSSFPVLILGHDGAAHSAKSWEEIPDFPRLNIMPLTPDSNGVSQFANSLLTWDMKMLHWRKYPRAAGDDGTITQRHSPREK